MTSSIHARLLTPSASQPVPLTGVSWADGSQSRDDAAQVWAALAGLLAGQPRMRLSRDGGRNYPTAHERALTKALPSVPAAVRITATDGLVSTICLDLDVASGGKAQVDADHVIVTRLIGRHGGRWIDDFSPNGGRHVYLPLTERVSFTEARQFVESLRRRLPSLDASPHQNAAAGCIRTPGSPHKTGGFQVLNMNLNTAYDVARRRNPASVWEALCKDLAEELAEVQQRHGANLVLVEDSEYLPLTAGPRNIPLAKQKTARTGHYDNARYGSPSEARQGVLASAAAAGWKLTDVMALMKQNVWAGMNSFYARYRPAQRTTALRRDWTKAVAYVGTKQSKNIPNQPGKTYDHKSYTSRKNTQGGLPTSAVGDGLSEHQFVRTWRNALHCWEEASAGKRAGLGYRFLLRALGEAAHKSDSRYIEFGVRSLALGTGAHHTTVARQLRELSQVEDPMLRLVQEAKGTYGDMYELILPDRFSGRATAMVWKRGRIHALRPVFRELGIVAAVVYETVETNDGALTSADMARVARLSPTSVNMALEVLAAWNLIERRVGAWHVVRGTSLQCLAEYFGVLEDIGQQLARYRQERAVWREWLARRVAPSLELLLPDEEYPFWHGDGPPDGERTLWDLHQFEDVVA